MAETESPTPQTASEPQLKAPKDKNCPFCGQAFTSSSLGRHLDLYIRPKNPKAPDGIHKVDEIRKMRGGITRRHYKGNVSTPRGSENGSRTPANKKSGVDSEDSSIMVDSPEPDDEDLEVVKSRSQLKDKEGGNGSRRPSRLSTKTPDLRRDTSRQMQKADLEQRQKTSEEAEVASATEMALRELLKSVREARYVCPRLSQIHANQTQCKGIRLQSLRFRSVHAQFPCPLPSDPSRTSYPLLPYSLLHF